MGLGLGRRLRQARATLFLGLLLGVFLVLSLFVHAPELLGFDLRVTTWLQSWRSPGLDGLARAVTRLGDTLVLLAFGLAAAVLLHRAGRPNAALLSALVPPAGLILNVLVKELIGRPRPDDGLVYVLLTPIGLSFPSGHAMASAVVYGFLALMAWTHVASRSRRLALVLTLATTILLVGLSRVYLGVHWFSDVIGGWTGGLLLLVLVMRLYARLAARPRA